MFAKFLHLRWLVSVALLIPALCAAQTPVALHGERIALESHIDWLRDSSGTLTINDIRGTAATRFVSLPGALNAGFTPDVIWLRVIVTQEQANPVWMLELSNPLLDDIRLYAPDGTGQFTAQDVGENVSRELWPVDYRAPVFQLQLPAGQHTIFLRLSARNALATTLSIWRPAAFQAMSQRDAIGYGLYFGMYALLLLFQGFFWRYSGSQRDALYWSYIFTNGFSAALSVGLLQQFVPLPGVYFDALLGANFCFALSISAKFLSEQLLFDIHLPRLERWLVRFSVAVSVFGLILIALNQFAMAMTAVQSAGLLVLVIVFISAATLFVRGIRPPAFMVIAFTIFYAGVAMRFLRNLGLMAPGPIADNGYQLAMLAHFVIISLGIRSRYDQLSTARQEAQAVSLEATREANARLETTVIQRTATLQQEITRRSALEDELRRALAVEREALQEQREFVAMVSHEFRTPLAIIDTTFQQLEKRPDASVERTAQRIHNGEKAVARMVSLMDQFLSLDRVNLLDAAVERHPIDLSAWLQSLADEYPVGRVRLLLKTSDLTFYGDPELLTIAMRNLLSNADRHSSAMSVIELSAIRRDKGDLELAVTDHGFGIPEDELDKLFIKYFRGRLAKHSPGAGLGLYLVARITVRHGGQVTVSSSEGQGSTFRLHFPLRPAK